VEKGIREGDREQRPIKVGGGDKREGGAEEEEEKRKRKH
jgi:hypothetical protein